MLQLTSRNGDRTRSRWPVAWVAGLVAALVLAVLVPAPSVRAEQVTKPTVVLVHGAWADPSGWYTVTVRVSG